LLFNEQGFDAEIIKRFGLPMQKARLNSWKDFAKKAHNKEKMIEIGIVGKYFKTGSGYTLADSYISVIEAVKHAAWNAGTGLKITWLNSEDYEEDAKNLEELKKFAGIIVPGGYGSRGIEGKIKAIQYLRENKIPFLGLCYGMQMATVEFARHVVGLEGAHTTEIDPDAKHPVIHTMEGQAEKIENKEYGGTMRLGAYDCHLKGGTVAAEAYGQTDISERHRHRYEFNNEYRKALEDKGMVFSGLNTKLDLVEIIELEKSVHPFFVGVQFHPEFKSRPLRPHPLFSEFVKAGMNQLD